MSKADIEAQKTLDQVGAYTDIDADVQYAEMENRNKCCKNCTACIFWYCIHPLAKLRCKSKSKSEPRSNNTDSGTVGPTGGNEYDEFYTL